MKRRRPKSRPVPLADLVGRFLKKQDAAGSKERAQQSRAMEVFATFVRIGPPITDYADPVFFRRGQLTLSVSDPTWMTELSLLEKQLVERMNRMLGRKLVKGMRLRLGNVRRPEPDRPPPRPLSPKQQEDVAEWAAHIADPVVKEAMIRAATKSLARGPVQVPLFTGPPGPRPSAPPPPPAPEKPRYGYGFSPRDRWKKPRS